MLVVLGITMEDVDIVVDVIKVIVTNDDGDDDDDDDDMEGVSLEAGVENVVGLSEVVNISLEVLDMTLVVLDAMLENKVPNSEIVKPAGVVRSVGQNSNGIVVPLTTVAPAARALSKYELIVA